MYLRNHLNLRNLYHL